MKKAGIILLMAVLSFGITGCGKSDGEIVAEPQWESVDGENNSPNTDNGGALENMDGAAASGAGNEKEAGGDGTKVPFVEGMIPEQSFETELDGWGKVFFASVMPQGESGTPEFMLIKNGETVYTFPETSISPEGKFEAVSAVAFQDYNKDGKKDVIVLTEYGSGENRRSEAMVFLQENSDNMFYLDHPELKGYKVDGKTETGPSFYRDTFLEEYLSRQKLTERMADLSDSWADYVDYADSLAGSFSTERQIKIFAENRAVWMEGMDYANDVFRFTVAGLSNDGRPVLIVSNQGGTGIYTYSNFYKIDKKGELQKLETSFQEGDSQPDIIRESMTVYSSFSTEGIKNHFIVYDLIKDSPGTYFERVSSLCVSDDFVLETPLASLQTVYEGEGYSAHITGEDCSGNALTKEEYENFADTYYGNMGLTKKRAVFKWIDVKTLEGISGEEAEKLLTEAYEGFSME